MHNGLQRRGPAGLPGRDRRQHRRLRDGQEEKGMTIQRNSNENNARRQEINHTDAEFFEIMNREGFVGADDLSGRLRHRDQHNYERVDGSHISIAIIPRHMASEPVISDALRKDVLAGFLRPVFDPNSTQLCDGDVVFGIGSADDRVWLKMTTPDAPGATQLPRHRENWLRTLPAELSQWTLMYAMSAIADKDNTLGSDELEDFYGAPRGSLCDEDEPDQIRVDG
jgi:hypothetical protein